MLMRFGTRVALNLMTSNSLVVVSPVCGGKAPISIQVIKSS